jgi:SAM-dependent methyltransferase
MATEAPAAPPLRLAERIFLKYCCVPPPPVPFEPRDTFDLSKPPAIEDDPLLRARRVYGSKFENALRDRIFLDIGCGWGAQVIGAAKAGAKLSVGVDVIVRSLEVGEAHARNHGVADRVKFTTDTIPTFGTDWADVALSQNSFEHFLNPEEILAQAHKALKPGGQFFVTFGPSWWHPFGEHNMFMIRMPWAHVIFSERTILRVRQLYRPNKPATWSEVSLNQMTVSRFLRLVRQSNFIVSDLSFTPIRPLPGWLVRLRPFREWTTADVSVILTKPRS